MMQLKMEESEKLHKLCSASKLEIINDANHVFNAKHPWTNSKLPKALNIVVQHTFKFIKKKPYLKSKASVIAIGFEPMTVCLEGRCSIQLSYATL